MSLDESDILLTEADGLLYNDTYQVSQVFIRCCGGPMYLRQRICELVKVPDTSPQTDDTALIVNKSYAIKGQKLLIKSSRSGTVRELFVKKDQIVSIGSKVVRVSVCRHPTMLGNTCGDCGVTIEEEDEEEGENAGGEGSGWSNLHHQQQETVAMLHSMPGLKVSLEEARRLGQEDKQHLLDSHKLVLLVDLDQTILHTTTDEPPPNAEDIFHFRLHQLGPVYHTRLRPYTHQFLKSASRLYQLHICTFGVREYAHAIARHLDPTGELFGDRILSRNECLDPMSKKANLKSLFPCGDELVCIIDDRADVWNFSPNVVQVLPYLFFEQTGDINAPPTGHAELNVMSGGATNPSDAAVYKARRKHTSKIGRPLEEGGGTHLPSCLQPNREATVQQQQRKMLQQQAEFNNTKVLACSPEQQERLQKSLSSPGSDSNSSSTAYSDIDEVGINGEEGVAKSGQPPLDDVGGDKEGEKIAPVSVLAQKESNPLVNSEKDLKRDCDEKESDPIVSSEKDLKRDNDEPVTEVPAVECGKVILKDESAGDVDDGAATDVSVPATVQSKDIVCLDSTEQISAGSATELEKPTSNKKESTELAADVAIKCNSDQSCSVPMQIDKKVIEEENDEKSIIKHKDDLEDATLTRDLTESKPSEMGTMGECTALGTEKKETSGDGKRQNNSFPRKDEKSINGIKVPEKFIDDVPKIVDSDDYLLHLEDILKKLHGEFYSQYKSTKNSAQSSNFVRNSNTGRSDENKAEQVGKFKLPDLKKIVPELRSEVLVGCNIVFSGVVPRGTDLVNSKAYGIATSLGARVCEDLTLPLEDQIPSTAKETSLFGQSEVPTTHVVAANLHTAKVKNAKSTPAAVKFIKVVTPDWLWTCWERWERVDERLYPLTAESEATLRRSPPHHFCAPPPGMFRQQSMDLFLMGDTAKKSMMEEVDEQCDSDDSAGASDSSVKDKTRGNKRSLEEVNLCSSRTSSSGNDDVEEDSESNSKDATFKTCPRPSQPEKKRKKLMRKKRKKQLERQFVRNPRRSDGVCGGDHDTDGEDSSDTDELPSVRFRRGGGLESGGEASSSSSVASDVEALDSGEEERLLKLEQDLMES